MSYWIDESNPGRLMSATKQIPFWADTKADIQNLPRDGIPGVQQGDDTTSCQPVKRGSTCTVIGNGSGGSFFVLNSDNEWKEM